MLKVSSTSKHTQFKLRMDEYVPFSFQAESRVIAPLYLEIEHGDRGLVEIGMDPRSGVVCKVVVTLFTDYVATETPWVPLCGTRVAGSPVCELSRWDSYNEKDGSGRFIDWETPISVLVGPNYARVTFGEVGDQTITACYSTARLDFGVDSDGYLRQLDIHDLDHRQMETLREYLKGKRRI